MMRNFDGDHEIKRNIEEIVNVMTGEGEISNIDSLKLLAVIKIAYPRDDEKEIRRKFSLVAGNREFPGDKEPENTATLRLTKNDRKMLREMHIRF